MAVKKRDEILLSTERCQWTSNERPHACLTYSFYILNFFKTQVERDNIPIEIASALQKIKTSVSSIHTYVLAACCLPLSDDDNGKTESESSFMQLDEPRTGERFVSTFKVGRRERKLDIARIGIVAEAKKIQCTSVESAACNTCDVFLLSSCCENTLCITQVSIQESRECVLRVYTFAYSESFSFWCWWNESTIVVVTFLTTRGIMPWKRRRTF